MGSIAMTQETNDVVGLIERLRLLARGHKFDAVPVITEAADALQSQSARIAEQDALLQRACWLMRPYCGGDEAIRIFRDKAISLTKDSASGD